jgi:CubicO group peptidase (beta-lactamase class C family)
VLTVSALAQAPAPASSAAASALNGFDEFVLSAMKSWNVPGMAVAIVKDGTVVLAKGYGLRNVQSNLPVTADTLFAIGSSTKAFTTMAMGCWLRKAARVDAPVTGALPRFALRTRSPASG